MQHLIMVFRILLGLRWLRRLPLVLVWLASLVCALGVTGCGSADLEPRPSSQEHVREVCWQPPEPELGSGVQCYFFPTDNGEAVATSCELHPGVAAETRGFTSKTDVVKRLERIRETLENGTFYDAIK